MKCYNHPKLEAVGYCSVCKRGVCTSCQVIMEGKRLCKQHAADVTKREERLAEYQKRDWRSPSPP